MGGRAIAGLVCAIIAIAVGLGMRAQQRAKFEKEAKYELRQFISECDCYTSREQTYLIGMCEAVHDEAFNDNVHSERVGRRSYRTTFDKHAYVIEAACLMADQATLDKRDDIAKSIEKHLDEKYGGK